MSDRERRIGRNEAIFRRVNEQALALNRGSGIGDDLHIVCECGDGSCLEHITLVRGEYEALRQDPALFAVVAGHELRDVEIVVRRKQRYWVVRKRPGEPGQVALATDPRRAA